MPLSSSFSKKSQIWNVFIMYQLLLKIQVLYLGAFTAAHLQITEMNIRLQTPSWAKIAHSQVVSFGEAVVQIPWQLGKQDRVQGSTNRASVIEGNSSWPSRSPLGGHVLFLTTAWPYRDTTRLESGKFPNFVVLQWFTSFKMFSDLFPLDKCGFLSIACSRTDHTHRSVALGNRTLPHHTCECILP